MPNVSERAPGSIPFQTSFMSFNAKTPSAPSKAGQGQAKALILLPLLGTLLTPWRFYFGNGYICRKPGSVQMQA